MGWRGASGYRNHLAFQARGGGQDNLPHIEMQDEQVLPSTGIHHLAF